MKLLIEGYHYKEEAIKSLGRLMGDMAWRDGTKSKNYVGYYYTDPSGNYFVYDLELMPRQFEHIDIQKVLSAEFLAEAEIRRKTGTAKLGWEEEWQGTPVYKTGKEIMEIMKR